MIAGAILFGVSRILKRIGSNDRIKDYGVRGKGDEERSKDANGIKDQGVEGKSEEGSKIKDQGVGSNHEKKNPGGRTFMPKGRFSCSVFLESFFCPTLVPSLGDSFLLRSFFFPSP